MSDIEHWIFSNREDVDDFVVIGLFFKHHLCYNLCQLCHHLCHLFHHNQPLLSSLFFSFMLQSFYYGSLEDSEYSFAFSLAQEDKVSVASVSVFLPTPHKKNCGEC